MFLIFGQLPHHGRCQNETRVQNHDTFHQDGRNKYHYVAKKNAKNKNAHKKKYRMQKEVTDKQEDLLFKKQNIIIFIIAGTDKGTPKVFPVRKDIHEI